MNKIMFNDSFGLTKAVKTGDKTMTRCIQPSRQGTPKRLLPCLNGQNTGFPSETFAQLVRSHKIMTLAKNTLTTLSE